VLRQSRRKILPLQTKSWRRSKPARLGNRSRHPRTNITKGECHAIWKAPMTENKIVDPICGMTVDPATAAGQYEYAGTTYYFCSTHCLNKFSADPESSLHPQPAKPSPPASTQIEYTCPMDPEVRQSGPGACPKCGMALEPVMPALPATKIEYTCPMHPEIVRDQPGACPICGMALEPRTITLHEEENLELKDMTRRFWVSVVLTLPLLLLAMSEMIPGRPVQHALSVRGTDWIQLVLATPVVLWGGWPLRALRSLR